MFLVFEIHTQTQMYNLEKYLTVQKNFEIF